MDTDERIRLQQVELEDAQREGSLGRWGELHGYPIEPGDFKIPKGVGTMKQETKELDMRPGPVAELKPLPTANPLAILSDAVRAGNVSIEVMERLMSLAERYEANLARKAYDEAMAAIRPDLPRIVKNNQVDFTTSKGRTRYKYEDLATVTEALSPVMAKHGLSFRWRTSSDKEAISVTCIVSHAAGHMEETTLTAPADNSGNKNGIQAIGSAVTYLQRYTLKAALGVAADVDDDGQASGPPPDTKHWNPPEKSDVPNQREPGDDTPDLLNVCPIHNQDWHNGKWGRFHTNKTTKETCSLKKILSTMIGGYSKQLGIGDEIALQTWLGEHQFANWKDLPEEAKVQAVDMMAAAVAEKLNKDDVP